MKPKKTFLNLPSDKQNRIVHAAVLEFADKGYQHASLNIIVASTQISKGSLYQYFDNKETLFLFVFTKVTEKIKSVLVKFQKNDNPKCFFDHIELDLLSGVSFVTTYPEYYEIYLKVLFEEKVPEREKLIREIRSFSFEYLPLFAMKQGLKI